MPSAAGQCCHPTSQTGSLHTRNNIFIFSYFTVYPFFSIPCQDLVSEVRLRMFSALGKPASGRCFLYLSGAAACQAFGFGGWQRPSCAAGYLLSNIQQSREISGLQRWAGRPCSPAKNTFGYAFSLFPLKSVILKIKKGRKTNFFHLFSTLLFFFALG